MKPPVMGGFYSNNIERDEIRLIYNNYLFFLYLIDEGFNINKS